MPVAKDWSDYPDTTTPINAVALEDLEARIGGSVQTGGALPGSPTNGQEVYYVADDTNGVVWHFIYRSASASSFKWEFVGGSPLRATGTGGTITSTTYQTTNAPSITLPALGGDYDFDFGGRIGRQAATGGADDGLIAVHDDGTIFGNEALQTLATQFTGGSAANTARGTGIGASSVITARYKTGAGTSTAFDRMYLTAVPVRVG